jgi:hypothetical protein
LIFCEREKLLTAEFAENDKEKAEKFNFTITKLRNYPIQKSWPH